MSIPRVDRTDQVPGLVALPRTSPDRRAGLLLESGQIVGLVALTAVALLAGCDRTAGPEVRASRSSSPERDRSGLSSSVARPVAEGRDEAMITEDEAIKIAKREIRGRVQTQKGAPITVKLSDDRFEVTFVHVTPPDSLGPGYDARVTIDAKTGEVLQAIQGPN